jgi:quinol monooxygenase YgiN
MSLPVLVGFAGVLVAAVATGLLAGRCVRQPRIDFILWTAATLALTVALAAQSMGFDRGFGAVTFRVVQLGALLLAPICLGWGLVELVAASDTVRFGTRLISAALIVVGVVIVVTDPLHAQPAGTSWPSGDSHFQPVALYALDVVQIVAVLAAVASVILAALSARQDPRWRSALPGVAAVGVAVLMTAGLRAAWPDRSVYPALSLLAAALVWFGVVRTQPVSGQGSGLAAAGDGTGHGPDPSWPPRPGGPRGAGQPGAPGDFAGSAAPRAPRASAGPAGGTARPYGRILIFTLLEDRVTEFDRLAEQAAEEVRLGEPGTLVYVIHLVPNAPLQRIFYEIYRDRAAFDGHESQPYMKRFVADRRSCVLATNVIELRLKHAKVAPLPGSRSPGPPSAGPVQAGPVPVRPAAGETQLPPEASRGRPGPPWLEPVPAAGTLPAGRAPRTPAGRPQAGSPYEGS